MLTPWKKSYDQPRWHIEKQRHYFANKGPSSQGYGFPVVMYGCGSWTVKKAECQRIDTFELWCWRRLLRVPWTARRFNQSILKEISPGCSFEGLMLKLKLHSFGHLTWRVDSFEKSLMLGKSEGRRVDNREWDDLMASLTQWTWVWVDSGSWWWTGRPGVLWFMGSQRVGHDWATELKKASAFLVCSQHISFSPTLWRRKWQPTLVFLPGESQGGKSLVGCSPRGSQRVRHHWTTSLSFFHFRVQHYTL